MPVYTVYAHTLHQVAQSRNEVRCYFVYKLLVNDMHKTLPEEGGGRTGMEVRTGL